ncbi:phospholipase A2-like [Thalassophryne amazonica]|uniref:phospholipase A2-like n=1 Tax=Thalassophryne amazonica TaxID=390379 RepID=UPI0014715F69|nr:phospholipase A2-like [Thalassophryne amazonica]
MQTLHCFFLLALSLSAAQAIWENQALNQFRKMILCLSPDVWPGLDYADYGCYCGLGGSGTPVDDLDRCCQVHDQCYSDAMQHTDCWPILDNPYTEFYDYTCDEANKKVTCTNNNGACEMFICECDRKAAECFAVSPWNPDHEDLPSENCQ